MATSHQKVPAVRHESGRHHGDDPQHESREIANEDVEQLATKSGQQGDYADQTKQPPSMVSP